VVPVERAVATSYSNHVSICSGLAAVLNGMFKAISGCISETVRDMAYLTVNHL